ncbi:hypothetical protein J2X31_001680 [Flavobacterium arsenatis]|uniref:Glycosyltransferase RgtA/B/C/D-like domain-containing protein n=1 Tax=Flavobacterium arsenatis TaxID=1484332 RepID=A0ABU1TP78_9FLAO|nr:hypothetical protein [Flavobacterium arsenatis]MDR6967668.1 hypothetical protein [Flavobacterium arsenatis]
MKRHYFYKYLFFFIVAFYSLILSQFGMENYDTGYIPSFSWRIINGEDAYQDFIYKGPPVTLYLNALLMKLLPISGQFFLFRIITYVIFSIQVYLCVSAFDNLYDFKAIRINKWAVMCICFMVSLLNFSPYPWPTLDGLFFVSIAFWLMSEQKQFQFFKSFTIAFLCLLCAFTKQSFYLVPFLFILWFLIEYGLKKAIIFSILTLFLLSIFLLVISSITSLSNYANLTTGETTLQQLYNTGFSNYVFMPWHLSLPIFILIGLSIFFYLKKTKQEFTVLAKPFKVVFLILFAISIFLSFFKIELASRVGFNTGCIGILYLFFFKKKNFKYIFPLIVSLGISWSVSISLGYPYPILFATGIILTLIIVLYNMEIFYFKVYILSTLSILLTSIALVAFSYNLYPYREKNIFNLTYSLGTISPKLKYIKTNKENFEKHLDLKELIKKYGNSIIVAPNFCMTNYIFDKQSQLPADWIINTEVNREFDRFIKLAAKKENYVFLEKSFVKEKSFLVDEDADSSYIGRYIYFNFKKVDETEHFLIYNSLKKK